MAAGHILRMQHGRPFVQLKMAVSGDGLIAPGTGAPVWVTGPEARCYAHLLRAWADAILVGRRTVADDDPELTCRLPGLEHRSPRRIVLDPSLQMPATSKLARSAEQVPVTIYAALGTAPVAYPSGVEIRRVSSTAPGRLDLRAVLVSLAAEGITRVMVEGGPTVGAAFLNEGLVDEAVIARGTEALGASGRRPLGESGLELFADRTRWHLFEERAIGRDRISIYRAVGRLDGRPGA